MESKQLPDRLINKNYKILLTALLALLLIITFIHLNEYEITGELTNHILQKGISDTGAINLVTAILFDYRGFDTLGEATIILTAAAALAFLVPKKRVTMLAAKFTIIVYQTVIFIIPFLAVLGLYLIFFGHLSPGGGFTGGVVLATIIILLTITYGLSFTERKIKYNYTCLAESLGALGFVLLGLLGIIAGSTFLASGRAGFNIGQPGKLFSAGLIPWLNLIVGVKVGAGLAIIFNSLIKEE